MEDDGVLIAEQHTCKPLNGRAKSRTTLKKSKIGLLYTGAFYGKKPVQYLGWYCCS